MKKNIQHGFTVVEGLLILVIVGIIGGTGWFVWNSNKKTNDTLNQADKSSNVTAKPSTKNQSTNITAGTKYVKEFYNIYDKSISEPNGQDKTVELYGTANLVSYYKGHQNGVDPIVCGQDKLGSISVTSQGISNGVEKILVTGHYSSESQKITVNVINQSSLKIDSITCPTPIPVTGGPAP